MLRLLLLLLLLPGALRAGSHPAPSVKKSLEQGSVLAAQHAPTSSELAPLQALLLPAARVSQHLLPGSALLPAFPTLRSAATVSATAAAAPHWCTAATQYLRHNYPAHAFW